MSPPLPDDPVLRYLALNLIAVGKNDLIQFSDPFLDKWLTLDQRMLMSPIVQMVVPIPTEPYEDATGEIAYAKVRDTNGDKRIVIDTATVGTGGLSLLSAMSNAMRMDPFSSKVGTGVIAASIAGPRWEPFSKDSTLAGGALADVELIAAVAGKKFEVLILHFGLALPIDQAGINPISGTFQDEDDAAVVPPSTVHLWYTYDTAGNDFAVSGGNQNFSHHGLWFITPTVAKALEVDYAGGAGIEEVHISGIYREV